MKHDVNGYAGVLVGILQDTSGQHELGHETDCD